METACKVAGLTEIFPDTLKIFRQHGESINYLESNDTVLNISEVSVFRQGFPEENPDDKNFPGSNATLLPWFLHC